jgi:DNA-binding response OmpR family regulator
LDEPAATPFGGKRILLIEDEPDIVRGLTDALEFEGFEVVATSSGQQGIQWARERRADCILLDLMLPDLNGYLVCEAIRRIDTLTPLIMLTARGQETDKVRGLDVGADDYVTKPFSVSELVARIKAIFRRLDRRGRAAVEVEGQPAAAAGTDAGGPSTARAFVPVTAGGDAPRAAGDGVDVVPIGPAEVNFRRHTLTRGRTTSPLTFYEVELLKLLYERLDQPVSRDEILDKIWGVEAFPSNRTVDNFIVKLRKKIEENHRKPKHILTVYGHGYKLVP